MKREVQSRAQALFGRRNLTLAGFLICSMIRTSKLWSILFRLARAPHHYAVIRSSPLFLLLLHVGYPYGMPSSPVLDYPADRRLIGDLPPCERRLTKYAYANTGRHPGGSPVDSAELT